jgi:Fic-DOC domain mobile mystery protein B
MTDTFAAEDGATPLTTDEVQVLIPSYIKLRGELIKAEQAGILAADGWAFGHRRDVLDENFLLTLHRRMFGAVWRWAGRFRQTVCNIGIHPWRIAVELRKLLNDVRFWIEHETYTADEIATRFHHRLVYIHPFPNGNVRHARLAADLLAVQLGRPRLTWGQSNLAAGEVRRLYIEALRAADRHDLEPLLAFVRS